MSPVRSLFVFALLAATLPAPAVVLAGSSGARSSVTWSPAAMTAATSYFPAGTSAMIVGVGEDALPVATALLETLQASDRFELAIDARALGKLDALADDEIVKRAFARPIKRVAIVRVFPAGDSVKAVVTVYAAQGQVTTAFTLAPGKALADNPTPEVAEDGVRRDELQTVQGTTGNGGLVGAAIDDGEVTYQRQQLVGVSHYGTISVENVSFFKNGRLISDTPALYDALGMKAEATAYRDRASDHRKWLGRGVALGTIGILGVCGFGTWWLVRAGGNSYAEAGTEESTFMPMMLTLGSVAAAVASGFIIRAHPAPSNLTPDEAVALVDAHKAKRRQTGGLHTPVTEIQLAPTALPSGGGFVVMGSF